jgi:RNA polymerase sigma-70 factor (ECF subfamily)
MLPHVTTLVDQAKSGSRTAFGQLVELFHEDIFRLVFYRVRTHMDAEDITQETFMKAYKNLSKLKKAERFRPWLYKIGLNQVNDFYREKRILAIFKDYSDIDDIDQSDIKRDDLPDALNTLLKQEFWKHIGLFLDRLSRMEREVFLLRFLDNLHIKEVSQILKRSESSVKTHLYRALKKFRNGSGLINLLKKEINT